MSHFTLITGGARSGKSRFAELLAAQGGLPVTYIATAQIWDEEMAVRIQKHREQRPQNWKLVEEPYHVEKALLKLKDFDGVILLDCVTLWLSNLLLSSTMPPDPNDPHAAAIPPGLDQQELSQAYLEEAEKAILAKVRVASRVAAQIRSQVIFVTNEVGQGIVPDNALARAYRDLAGRCNQILAQEAEAVYLVVAGYPLEIKQSGQQLLSALRQR